MKINSLPRQAVAGFTLIELLFVGLIVGLLSAIAGPSWISFSNRQQVNAINEAVLGALQEAQQKAKTQKRSYSVSFRTASNVLQFAIDSNLSPTNWQTLGKNAEIKAGKVLLGTNLTGPNVAGAAINYASTTAQTITFDHMGQMPRNNPQTNLGTKGLIVTVAVPKPGAPTQPFAKTKRCVKVMTLLGSIQTAKQTATEDDCKAL